MRRPVSERDAVRSQVIDALEAQEIEETGNEERLASQGQSREQKFLATETDHRLGFG